MSTSTHLGRRRGRPPAAVCGADRLQDRNRHWAARGPPRAQHAGEHPAPGIDGGVDFGDPRSGASQGMITRPTVHHPGAVVAGAGGVHVGSASG